MKCWLLSLWIAQLLENSLIPAMTPSASQDDLHNCTHLLKPRLKHLNEETSNTSLVMLYVSPTAILHKIRLSPRPAPCFCCVSVITCFLWCSSGVVVQKQRIYCMFLHYSDARFRNESGNFTRESTNLQKKIDFSWALKRNGLSSCDGCCVTKR